MYFEQLLLKDDTIKKLSEISGILVKDEDTLSFALDELIKAIYE